MKKFTKRLFMTSFVFAAVMSLQAQTVLINPATDGAFEGASFAADGWSVLNNATTNVWVSSTGATAGFTGTNCAYITNNAAGTPPPHAYTNSPTARVSALYRDVTVPAGETQIALSFKWICNGESGYDRLQVWAVPTSYTPLNLSASMTTTGSAPTGRVQLGTGATGYVGTTSWGTANITVPAAYAGTSFRLVFQWRNDGSGGIDPPIAIDDVSLVSSCTGAVTAAATAIGTTTATLNATAFAGATGYNFRYRVVGSPTWILATGNPYAGTAAAVTSLSASSNYEFQVAATGAVCNTWSVSRTFTTLCAAIASLPWTEGFEGVGTVGAGVFPPCWSYVNVTGTNSPGTYATSDTYRGPRTGSKHAYTQYNTTAWTFTPAFTLTTGVSYDFSFFMMNKSVSSPVDFVMDVAYGSSASDAGMTTVLQSGYSATNSAYTQFKYTFTPAATGDYFFGYKSTSGSFTPWYLSFDDFKLEVSPACISPTASSATNITNSSADYNFTCSSCSGNYIVEYGATGFTPGTGATAGTGGTVIATSTLTGTIGSLAALTGYQYYVRQICTGPTYSTNAGPVSFTTSMDCSTATNISGCATNFTVTTTAATGAYNPVATSCGYGTPGEEKLYTFTPTITGVHQLSNVSGATGGYLDVFIKASSGGCGSTGWTCINDYSTTVESNATPLLTAGTQYYLLFDGEVAAAHNQTFNIVCPIPAPANDECATAVVIDPDLTCTGGAIVSGTIAGATTSGPAATTGTANDDVWYSFVAENTTQILTLSKTNSTDFVTQVFSGACGSLVSYGSYDTDPNNLSLTSLTVGATYFIRVYSYYTAVISGSDGTFSLCLQNPPPPPANDDCVNAIAFPTIPTSGACSQVTVNTAGATGSLDATCSGAEDDDVWYSFTVPVGHTSVNYVNTNISGSTDRMIQVLTACGGTNVGCYDPESGTITGLTAGTAYVLRTYTYGSGVNSNYTICLSVPPPPPTNDNCANAIAFPTIPVDGSCSQMTVNTTSATGSLDATCFGAEDDDVWYTFTVPAGRTSVNYANTTISGNTDRMIQILTACGGTNVGCYDPESGTITGLTAGTTYVLRTYTYSSAVNSNYTICLSVTPPPPANDDCAGAKVLQFCSTPDTTKNLGGATQSLSASTSCLGNSDDDVWYSFVATTTNDIYITLFSTYDAVLELRSGTCSSSSALDCSDNGLGNDYEDIIATGLTVGQTYYVRAYSYGATKPTAADYLVMTVAEAGCWLGTFDANWNSAGNWSDFTVPNTCASNVTIPAGTTFAPSITSASYTVGNINIASGVNLTLTGNNLNVCGNWTAGTGVDAVTVGTGNVVLQGTGAQAITGNTSFESLTVNSGVGSYTNSGTTTISRLFRPQTGTLSNSGSLTFLSTSATNIATIDLTTGNTGTISGNIIAQRFVPVSGSNQHYVSSPINNLPLSQFGASGGSGFVVPTATCDETQLQAGSPYGSVFRYSEANGASCSLAGWEVVNSGNAENARGYSAYLTGAGAPLSVTGAANMNSTYTKTGLTNSNWTNTTLQGRTQNSGWSLVGNPYLSTINLADKLAAGIDNQAQVWQTSGPYVGTYQAVIMGSGTAFVAPFQGFMVHKTATGSTVDFAVGRTECVNSTATFYKTGNSNGTLSIKVSGNGYNDITKVVFDDQATNNFDPAVDANKLPVRLVQPSVATKIGSTLYAINTLESISTNPIVPMDFMAGTNGAFTFTVDDIATFDPTVMIYLEDKKAYTGWQDLRANNTYTFTGATTDVKDRFVLHFEPAAFVSNEEASCTDGGIITVNQEGATKWTVSVTDDKNVIVSKAQVLDAANPLSVTGLVPGQYTVNFVHSSGYTTTQTVDIIGSLPLAASFTATNLTPSVNQSVVFSSNINQAASVEWNFGDGTSSTLENPSHVYAAAGNYTVMMTATSNEGCVKTYAQNLSVRSSATGINNVASAKEVSAYTLDNNKVVVAFKGYTNETAKISLYNVLGQELFTTNTHKADANFVHTIDQVEMQYVIVRVTVGGQTITKKVVVSNK